MRNVPSRVPVSGWSADGADVMHVLQPRVFCFPTNRQFLPSDTEVTQNCTDLLAEHKRVDSVTSLCRGAVCDFGIEGALVAMLIFGFIVGRLFRGHIL